MKKEFKELNTMEELVEVSDVKDIDANPFYVARFLMMFYTLYSDYEIELDKAADPPRNISDIWKALARHITVSLPIFDDSVFDTSNTFDLESAIKSLTTKESNALEAMVYLHSNMYNASMAYQSIHQISKDTMTEEHKQLLNSLHNKVGYMKGYTRKFADSLKKFLEKNYDPKIFVSRHTDVTPRKANEDEDKSN